MITNAIDLIMNNKLYKQNKAIEISKGFYNKGNYLKKVKRYIKRWL